MINDILQRLMAAQTEEERRWIATESLLESLPKEVKSALWAVAIPHWFNVEILAALCPELADRAEEIYRQLQTISCVEVFPERGHNVHELTRNQLLERLWKDSPERFRELSDRAAVYFAQTNRPENQIEWIYHLAVANPDRCINELSDLANAWQNAFRRAELDSLIAFLQMQIRANRTTVAVKAETIYWDGKIKSRFYQAKEALERYEAALAFYREIGARLGEANTLQAIGAVLRFLKRSTEALEMYEEALTFFREIDYSLGEANTLKAIGDVLQFLKQSTKALQMYEAAIAIYCEIGDRLGEANTLKAIGDVLQFLKRSTEALEKYKTVLAFYHEIGAHLGEANTLQSIAILEEDPVIGLASSQTALNLYIEIGDKYSQARNLNYFTSNIQLKLGQKAEAISSLTLASKLAQEINYQPMVDYANQKIAEINGASQGIRGWFNWIKTKLWKD